MELAQKKKDIVRAFLRDGILVGKPLLEQLQQPDTINEWHTKLSNGSSAKELIEKKQEPHLAEEDALPKVRILWEYDEFEKKREVKDFVDYFNARYRQLEAILRSRQELQGLMSIGRLKQKSDRGTVSIIGLVQDKQTTKNNHIILTLEDPTGLIKVLVSTKNKELHDFGRDIVLDEAIGVTGMLGEDIIFANSIITPDIPFTEVKKAPEPQTVAVLSCVHVGSAQFEDEKFEKFVKWTKGEHGTEEERALAKHLKYIIICGDVVDGIGIYPTQEKELRITDIYGQYEECARLLRQIPEHITLVIGPGNHDACRIAEPQPKLPRDYAAPLYEIPNAVLVCNPCYINIAATETFPGFNVLMYHGYSFDDYGEIVPSIKNSGLHLSDRAPHIMKFLLQRRHLSPQHATSLYLPDPRKDPMVIERVPDMFVAGHIHKSGTLSYRGVSIVSGSCFQGKTDFQEKVGHEPDPGTVPVINLQSRKIALLRF